jgi:hypothetical protein
MTKIFKPAILFSVLILNLQSAYGQAQVNVTDLLSQRFIKYCNTVPREEIYVHSDREQYIAGEDLWFNIYLIDRQSLKPSSTSSIAYFELLNPENRPVVQKRLKLYKGFGPGQVVLPDTLSTGTYTIRAYTSWMKNFLPENCFQKDIKVFNAFNTKKFKAKLSSDDIPKAQSVSGTELGIVSGGLVLTVNNHKPDILELTVTSDENYGSRNNNLCYLFIQTHGIINLVRVERITQENTNITISKSVLIPGINQITIFDSKGQPLCEKYIYTPGEKKAQITVNSIESCSIRDKITLAIEPGDELSGAPGSSNISVSVAPETNDPQIPGIDDYLVFGSEFGPMFWTGTKGRNPGEIPPEEMDSLLSDAKSNWITWETILTDNPPVFRYQVEKEDQFLYGRLLTSDNKPAGRDEFLVMSSPGKKAVFEYARTDNEGSFHFDIHIDDGLKDLIIQPDDISKNYKIDIESSFSNKYLPSALKIDTAGKNIPPYISTWSVNYQVKKIYGSSSTGDPLLPVIPSPVPKRFYGKPDIELILADYIKLPVMQEVFFELIPGVFLRSKKSVYDISIADPMSSKIYEVPPGLMIDGVIINDPNIIGNLDPELVEQIDVIKERYFVGNYLFFGIVNVITKSGDFGVVSLPGYAVRLPYRVTEPVWSFVSPDYSSAELKNSRVPDFRNTLYWNPAVKYGDDGKAAIAFWTSDMVSNYQINIQGITSDGKPFSIRKIFKVK